TSGELAKLHRDHVGQKASAADDKRRLDKYVLPLVRKVPMRAFTLDHAEQVMRSLPSHLSTASRRQIAQLVNRIASLAVYPLRLVPVHPLPRGWMPKIRPEDQRPQAKPYPDEADRLTACAAVPFGLRLLVGFIAREGMRHEEAE